jgi:hypothetical protein
MPPRHRFIIDSTRHAIVANGHDLVIAVDDTGTNLGGRIFAPESAKLSHPHEVLVPFEIIAAMLFFHTKNLFRLY